MLAQWKQVNITLLSDRINVVVVVWRPIEDRNVLIGGIISYLAQIDLNKEGSTTPLIDSLEMTEVFKDKDKEEEASVMDFIR